MSDTDTHADLDGIVFRGECSECDKPMQLTGPMTDEFKHKTEKRVRCSDCGHINVLEKA